MPAIDKVLEHQMKIIRRGVAEILPEQQLIEKVKKSIKDNTPLKVKLGLDPTAPDIHIGHTVVLRKLKQFQDLGHHIIIVIGDFTGMVGDPTGKSETRKQLSEAEILENAKTYEEQIFRILDKEKTEVVFNSLWLRPLNFADILKLAAKYTVARMLERDDFSKRFKEGKAISIHEFFYPLMQGYDSVALNADIEFGGTDQTFNLLMGRHLQEEYGQEPQFAITMPILEGLDGTNKMSKSLGNYIGINEAPGEMYGKTMSVPDELMLRYYELVSDLEFDELEKIVRGYRDNTIHPRDLKMRLAHTLVRMYHGLAAADKAQEEFIKVFQKRDLPDEIQEVVVNYAAGEKIWLPKLLCIAGLTGSNGEARRLIQQGAVKLNNTKFSSNNEDDIILRSGSVLQVGKRKFAKIICGKK